MAVPGERATIDGDGEPRIPVFTVVKNGAVLKNIFVVDKPPPPSPPPPPPPGGPARPRQADGAKTAAGGREGRGEMLIVGRHPDCHIMLTHPSISRFHLQIHSDPSRRKLSVVDLSSVHGTWVSEKKIEPGVVVELSEGDTLRVGGSSRVYRLHWVPLSRAYDFENPFVSALDASGADEEKEEEDLVIDEGKVEEEREDEDSLEIGCEDDDDLESSFVLEDEEHVHQDSFQDENKGIHSPESLLKGVEALALDDCEELPAKNQSPSQLPIPENPYASTYGEKETDAGLGSKAVDDFFMLAEYLQTEPMDASSPFRILFDVDNQKFNEEKWSTEVGIATKLVSANKGSIRSAHDDLENCLVAEAFEDNRKFNEEKWSTEVGIATELVSANEGSIRSAHDDLENCVVAEAFVDNRKFNEEKWSTEVGIATELVSADEGSMRSAHDDLENCSVAEACEDNQKFNEEKWSTEVGIATELVSADEGSMRSAHDDLENCLVAEACEDNQKFNEEKWSTEVGIATELVSADEGSMRSAHDDLENCLVAEACEDNQKFNEEKCSAEVGIATELVSADEGSIRSAHDHLENCSVAEACGDNQKFNEEKWSTEVGIATELVSADEGSMRSAHDDLENCLVAEACEDNQKFNEEKCSAEVGIATELVSADEGSIRSAHDDLENCSVAEACGDNQKFNEEKWSTEVGNATELVSADEGSIRSADDDLENCSVAEAFGDSQKFNEERWSTEVGIATELVSADEGSIRSAHDDLENCLVAEDFEDNWKFNGEKWSMEVGIAAELVSADEGSIKSAHDDLENCSVAETFEGNQKFNEEKWSMEVGIATELVSADEGSMRSAHDDPENCLVAETFEESKCTLSIDSEVGDSLSHPSAPYYPCSSCPEIFSEMENQQLGQEDNAEQPFNTLGSLSSGGKTRTLRKERKPFTSMLIDDARPRKGCSSAVEIREESQNQVTHIDNQEDGDTLSHHFAKSLADTITSSESDREILLETTDQHLNDENQRPQYGSVTGRLSESGKESSPLGQSCTKSKCSSIWSRRGKPSTLLQLQTNRRKGMTKSAATASRNKQHSQDNNENQLSAVPFLSLDGEEEEIFTPDKENLTPNTRLLKSLKKISKMEVAEARPAESFRRSSSKLSPMANICNEEDVFYSDKENQTPEGLRGQKMARRASGSSSRLRRELGLKQGAERSAFKSLNVRSGSQSTASGGAMKSGLSVDGVRSLGRKVSALSANKSYGEPNKSWIMVVDTTSFLNKESMKSLQLLQGLKETQLFIPRIVIRELDCLKRRASVFRRTTEVSSALEWIEDTMVNLKWWIHVQRSMEEGMSVAPTPPATPRCIFGDVSATFSAATPGGSVMDIISPTTEDHVLESALFYRKTNPNGQLVLLSNDISLKIKAMAEGILCETAQEFRESLVNPFSDRFLWADSSPRGQTWSCLDDVVLKEKYYSRPSKKSARGEGLSGLKLILLHNSQYGQQIRSVG